MPNLAYTKSGIRIETWKMLCVPQAVPSVRLTGRTVGHVAGCVNDRWGWPVSGPSKNIKGGGLSARGGSNPGRLGVVAGA